MISSDSAGVNPTFDLDGIGSANTADASLTAGQARAKDVRRRCQRRDEKIEFGRAVLKERLRTAMRRREKLADAG